ncbi:hypothetical protein RhiXN_07545 [Rhizoctonia solani]|uniref:Chromo domain-containing protein n=1 Tax=Rhizoctonia solani TaxID=456999 RepID=A0A8H8P856_9AGAM|nr:uncharacterized protein RhiXN_07545 [Rhizoctonia solani]QRW25596.1 hypothetical protein RhiXN_07545 [Rhizoctonia solani]
MEERNGKWFFRVKWKGYGPEENTWEPQENLKNAGKILRKYEEEMRKKALGAAKALKGGQTPGKESGEGLIQEVDKEMADLWTQEWVDNNKWEQVQEDDKGMEGGKSGDEENNAALTAEEPVEYNNDGRISARSKGKGLATH